MATLHPILHHGKINTKKYKNAVLYFISHCNNQFLGATKLNKLLYYLDFISYRDRGKNITGDNYIHKDYGPVPDQIDDVLVNLKRESKISVEIKEYKDGGKYAYDAKVKPDMSIFDEYERKLLDSICEEFELWSTHKIVSQTHLEAPWFYSKPFDVVDYEHSSDIDFFI